jgi:hypothetical protein
MTLQAYLDNIQAKTGKTPKDFQALARKKGLVKRGEIVAWLKADFALGHGHANAIAHVLESAEAPKVSREDKIAAHFAGKKSAWRKPYDGLMAKVGRFGPDIEVSPTKSYLSLLRAGKKFAVLEPATPERLDLGIKLKRVAPAGRLEAAGAWNAMVTHRVRISDPKEIDPELLAWLKQAYEAA